ARRRPERNPNRRRPKRARESESDSDSDEGMFSLGPPVRRRAPLPVPYDQVRPRRLATELAQPRRVLAGMVVTVHRALREGLGDRDRQRRLLEPRHLDLLVETRLCERLKESWHLLVVLARVRFQVGKRPEVLW